MGAPWPGTARRSAAREARGRSTAVGRSRPQLLGVSTPVAPFARRSGRLAMATLADRPLHPGEARSGGNAAGRPGRQADSAATGDARSHGTAALGRGNRRVPARRRSARLRTSCRPAAGFPAIRRALGAALARRRPLCRQQRHGRQPRLLRRLALSRLRDRRVQRRQALTTGSSKSSSPATCSPNRSRHGATS